MDGNASARVGADARIEWRAATDATLWQIATREDPDAFGIIFDRHADAVHRYCARRAGSADAADDLVSIVFLEAWRRRAEVTLRHDSALPWLFGVARHTLSHRARTRLRYQRALERIPRASVALGVPIGTVRSRLSRARVRLAALTDQQPGTGTNTGSKDA